MAISFKTIPYFWSSCDHNAACHPFDLIFRRLREVEYYRDDPLVLRLLGLNKIPDVSTISRNLAQLDMQSINNIQKLSRTFVIYGLQRERFPRLTLDFDGYVLSTKGHAEGSAIGFDKAKKSARSYYPLFCTVAQTGQFFDMHHRPGNSTTPKGASDFMLRCFEKTPSQLPGAILESCMDRAFFNKEIISLLAEKQVQFTASVPFAKFTELKRMIETFESWSAIDEN